MRIKYHIIFGNFTERILLTRGPIIHISWTRWEVIKSATRLSWYLVLMYGEATWLESESFPLATWTVQKNIFRHSTAFGFTFLANIKKWITNSCAKNIPVNYADQILSVSVHLLRQAACELPWPAPQALLQTQSQRI